MLLQACVRTTLVENKVEQKAPNTLSVPLAPLSLWQERTFAGQTRYTLDQEKTAILATADNTASMLYRKFRVDLEQTPYLNWQWQISNTLGDINEQTRSGDDYAARIYIAIKPAALEIVPRALTYVWASNENQFSSWPNAYTENVKMLALQSGEQLAGEWVQEKRNLKDDLQKHFNEDIRWVEGIAIMSDTDNSSGSASAGYRGLYFSKE